MEKLASRNPNAILFGSMLLGMAVGAAASYFFLGESTFGTSAGTLVGLAIGGLLTRQARPQFAIPLLAIIGAGVLLLIVLVWRSSGA